MPRTERISLTLAPQGIMQFKKGSLSLSPIKNFNTSDDYMKKTLQEKNE